MNGAALQSETTNRAAPPLPSKRISDIRSIRRHAVLLAGLLAILLPTMLSVAQMNWATEQGAHGPLVLTTGLWLIWRHRETILRLRQPAPGWITALLLLALLPLYAATRITGIIELEGLTMYAVLIAVLHSFCGNKVLRLLWFPLVYLLFVFPPPDTLVAVITQPLKIAISDSVIETLHVAGYPIAGSGVTIQIGQYELLVAAACAGLNSLISLSAIGLFYIYIRHNANWRYAVLLVFAIVPVAILANFIRVILLVLLTYHLGEAAAQGFAHNFAGITMFVISVLGIFAVDGLASPLRRKLGNAGRSS